MGEAKRRQEKDPNFGKAQGDKESNQIKLEVEPDYSSLVELYLSQGVGGLMPAILQWLLETGQIYQEDTPSALVNRANQVGMTVYNIASKQSKNLSAKDFKCAEFHLQVPTEPDDFIGYAPVLNNWELASEAMRLVNTGFFEPAINFLINLEGNAVGTLRKYGIVLYMGTNNNLEIIDAACALARWNPFEVSTYAGEQRNSLNRLIEKVFSPLSSQVQKFRIEQKGSDKFPCLSLLCIAENKHTGAVCDFRRHYTAQGGSQLIIPGFSRGAKNAVMLAPPMDVLGKPRNVPTIRGFSKNNTQ